MTKLTVAAHWKQEAARLQAENNTLKDRVARLEWFIQRLQGLLGMAAEVENWEKYGIKYFQINFSASQRVYNLIIQGEQPQDLLEELVVEAFKVFMDKERENK